MCDAGFGICRAKEGTDPSLVANRVAFIEKTPRVRIRGYWGGPDDPVARSEDWKSWAEGSKGDGPTDESSRDWCDKMLVLLGYELG